MPRRAGGALLALAGVVRLAWRASAPLTAGLAVLVLIAGLVPATTVAVARAVVDTVIEAVHGGVAPGAAAGPVLLLVGLQFVVSAANAVGNAVRAVVERLLGERLALTVQLDVMRHASRLELPFFESSDSYDLLRQPDLARRRLGDPGPVRDLAGGFSCARGRVATATPDRVAGMKAARAFGRFWYDLIIGDDWKVAAGVAGVLLAVTLAMWGGLLTGPAVPVLGTAGLLGAFALALVVEVRRSRR